MSETLPPSARELLDGMVDKLINTPRSTHINAERPTSDFDVQQAKLAKRMGLEDMFGGYSRPLFAAADASRVFIWRAKYGVIVNAFKYYWPNEVEYIGKRRVDIPPALRGTTWRALETVEHITSPPYTHPKEGEAPRQSFLKALLAMEREYREALPAPTETRKTVRKRLYVAMGETALLEETVRNTTHWSGVVEQMNGVSRGEQVAVVEPEEPPVPLPLTPETAYRVTGYVESLLTASQRTQQKAQTEISSTGNYL